MTMTAVCTMNNCRRLCPDDEPFCSEHRDKAIDWKARAEAAESSRDDLLRQLEEAKGEVERWHNKLQDEQIRVSALLKAQAKAEIQRDALLDVVRRCKVQFEFYVEQHLAKKPPDAAKVQANEHFANICRDALLRTAHEAAAHNTGEGK